MITNLILIASIYLVLPLMYLMMRNNAVAKKSIVLSVTLPSQAQSDPEVLQCIADFKKRFRLIFWVLTAALIPCVFLPWVSVTMTVSMVWLVAALVWPFAVYGKSYKRLLAVKRRRGWVTASAGQTVVELKTTELPKPVKTRWFVPPMILSVLPVLSCILDDLDPGWSLILITTAAMCLFITALGLVYYGIVFRQRADAVDGDRDLTAALTRVRRYNWNKFWLLMCWATAFYSLAVWLSNGSFTWYMVWTLVYTVVLLAASFQTEFAARRAQRRLTEGRQTAPIVDEDDYWLWGQVYYNPHNNRAFVNERVGMGLSMNLAHPAGKILMGLSVLLILAMPLMGVWMMTEEFTTISMEITEDAVVMRHTGVEYTVDFADVEEAEILTDLPDSIKMNGTGMENLYKGSFSVDGYGAAKLCLDPHAEEFLVLVTEGETYLFSGDPGQAEEALACWEAQ